MNDFADIAPYDDQEFSRHMHDMVKEPGFEHAIRWIFPDIDFDQFVSKLVQVESREVFQRKIMFPFLENLAQRTTSGINFEGLDRDKPDENYAFITNHRDIVLDAAFLNVGFLRQGRPTSQIAIGDNLLIYDWITDLVKLNGSFIVKRNDQPSKALINAKHLSSYIHYAINVKKESIWIAQRQGRAKDSNDVTQESLIKMLSLGGKESIRENLRAINLFPVSITYEYDPNDYLKAREFLLKERDPEFKKSQRDDLFSMETGLLEFKGHVNICLQGCINDQIDAFPADLSRQDVVKNVCHLIDRAIHAGYKIYPINYVAYDRVYHTCEFSEHYTAEQERHVTDYIEKQLDKVDIPDVTPAEREFMRNKMLEMYANPLKNRLAALIG